LSTSITDHASELKEINFSAGTEEVRKGKRSINRLAQRMQTFAERIEAETPLFRSAYSMALDSYGKAATLLKDFKGEHKEEVEQALATVTGLSSSLGGAKEGISGLQEVIHKLPRVTTEFNRAKRRSVKALESLFTEMDGGLNLTMEVSGLMSEILGSSDD
jgi:chromosome segregation ATPase